MIIDAISVKERCVEWIRDFFKESGEGCNAVVGISGGKDSSTVAALCVQALGKQRVVGVLMPSGEQPDIDMAFLLVRHLEIKHYVGYATRYGDAVGDFSPLCDLTVTEVKAIAEALGLPKSFVEKPPIDGLCGKTDEENLGFTYATLDRYIRTGQINSAETKARIDELHRMNLFKLRPMPGFKL